MVGAEAETNRGKLPDTVTLTKNGGRYYRAIIFWHTTTALAFVPVTLLLIIATLNPLWFCDSFFRWVESAVNKFARWRNYRQYALYLGCDPTYWHTLASK